MKTDSRLKKFCRLLGIDFYRLFRSASFYIIFGICAAMEILNILLYYFANGWIAELVGNDLHFYANSLFADFLSYGNIGLFIMIFFAVFLCSDFKNNTIRYKVCAGYSRTMVYFASLAFTYIVSAMVVAFGCAVGAAGIPLLGWNHTEYELLRSLYALFALLPFIAFVHTVSYGTKSVGIALGIGLPVLLILPAIFQLLATFAAWMPGVEWFIRTVFLAMESYVPVELSSGTEILPYFALNVSLCYIAWTALFVVCGYLSFVKSDIK